MIRTYKLTKIQNGICPIQSDYCLLIRFEWILSSSLRRPDIEGPWMIKYKLNVQYKPSHGD